MPDELQRKLGVLGGELSKVKLSPSGNNLDEFTFAYRVHGHGLTFNHDAIKVTLENFKLIDAETWRAKSGQRAVERNTRYVNYWYEANVSVVVGTWKGAGSGALGDPVFRGHLLAPIPHERDVIEWLLVRADKLAGYLFNTDMVEQQPIAEEPTDPEEQNVVAGLQTNPFTEFLP